jgi:PilX N-terminal
VTVQDLGNHQRGVAALVVTMTLFFAMLLIAVFANRNLVFEQRSSANQYRATQAFEAAEAGLEWAQAQLNNVQRVGPDCKATSDPTAASFRDRYLTSAPAAAGFVGHTWNNAGVATPLQPNCVRSPSGWQCSCPSTGYPQLSAPAEGVSAPAFALEFLPGTKSGSVRVAARGCSSLGGVCAPGGVSVVDASARVEVTLALLPGLASAPAAPLTARGNVSAPGAELGIHNGDVASGGVAVHAGGNVDVGAAHSSGPAGAPLAQAVVANDVSFATLTANQFFATFFGHDRAGWAAQPVVSMLTCAGNCAGALVSAAAQSGSVALIQVSGNAAIEGPVTLGSPQQPVLIVIEGAVQLRGPVTLYGLLYGATVSWNGPIPGGALVRGALVSEAGYQGDGTPELIYDAGILDRLRTRSGTFARVSGSWRDF